MHLSTTCDLVDYTRDWCKMIFLIEAAFIWSVAYLISTAHQSEGGETYSLESDISVTVLVVPYLMSAMSALTDLAYPLV
jgi:hypothetical protein